MALILKIREEFNEAKKLSRMASNYLTMCLKTFIFVKQRRHWFMFARHRIYTVCVGKGEGGC
jgi:hypothetical protein